jgi:DNA-binding winged helix-turn-helix (wHTH) protein/Tol biopolymer transport system component
MTSTSRPPPRRYRFDDLTLDTGQHRVWRGAEEIQLSKLSFDLLRALVEAAPNLLTPDQLTETVWGPRRVITPENLSQRVMMLRHALGDHAEQPRYVEAVRGQGYRLMAVVETVAAPSAPEAEESAQPVGRRALLVAAGLAVGGALAGIAAWMLWPVPAAMPVARFLVSLPATAPLASQGGYDLAISPDGSRLVYVAQDPQSGDFSLHVRDLNGLEVRPIPGTEVVAGDNMNPFFSADGAWIGFGSPGQGIMRVAIDGGLPHQIVHGLGVGGGATAASDDTFIFSPAGSLSGGDLYRVSARGGTPEPMTAVSQTVRHTSPKLLPGERAVLFTKNDGVTQHVAVLDLETGQSRMLIEGATAPMYAPTGHIVFARGTTLMAAPFDLVELAVTGAPMPVLQGVRHPPAAGADFAVSATGTLVYVPHDATATSAIVWADRNGQVGPAVSEPVAGDPRDLRLSPDSTKLALTKGLWPDRELWIYDLGGRPPIPLAGAVDAGVPVFSPDGVNVAFSFQRSGSHEIHVLPADGSIREPRLLHADELPGRLVDWSAEGDLLLVRGGNNKNVDIVAVPLAAEGEVRDVVVTDDAELEARLSPNGRWLAYASTRTAPAEIWVKAYPDGVPVRVSSGGGREPVWSLDGRELFYRRLNGAMMAVAVETEGEFSFDSPVQLFNRAFLNIGGRGVYFSTYDVAGDGRFLMIQPSAGPADNSIVVVQNWFEELKHRVPTE